MIPEDANEKMKKHNKWSAKVKGQRESLKDRDKGQFSGKKVEMNE